MNRSAGKLYRPDIVRVQNDRELPLLHSGQFHHSTMELVRITDRHGAVFHHGQVSNNSTLALGLLKKGDDQIPVTLQDKTLKDTLNKRHLAQCWVVPKVEVEHLLERPYKSYVVDDL